MRRMPRRLAMTVAICLFTLVPAAGTAAARTILSLSGSTSVYPLATGLASAYFRSHPVGFRIFQGGSDIGINDVAHGRVDIGDSSRDPIPGVDPHGLVFHKIARDGVCIVTSPANPIGNLSQREVQAIFSGQIRNWNQVPGHGVNGAIDIFTRTPASGTADAFRNIFMYPFSIAGSAVQKQSNGLVESTVHSDSHAIGFVSFDFIGGTHTVGYEGVPCTLRNAKSGAYQGVRNFWMVTRGGGRGQVRSFIRWVQHNGRARRIVSSNWIPLG